MTDKLLEIEDLHIAYRGRGEDIRAVSNASASIGSNEYFGLLGESGCGKSTLAKSLFGGLDKNGEVVSGSIKYKGEEIQDFSEEEFNDKIRWDEIAVIPQAAMDSLNPLSRISTQAVKLVKAHTDREEDWARERLKELFTIVGITTSRIDDYPHQFSGGMQQRAMIALSLLLDPSLLVADEPTTALDVIMQDQILHYLSEIREDQDISMLLITHDISVIFETCDSAAVMHGGQIAEKAPVRAILDRPRHPYTILLQEAFPDIRYPDKELETIEGSPPTLQEEIDYCTFADRCPWAESACRDGAPPLEAEPDEPDQQVGCIRSDEMTELAADYLADDSDATWETEVTEVATAPEAGAGSEEPVMELRNLQKHFSQTTNVVESIRARLFGSGQSPIRAVDGVNLELSTNQVQGIIGESGCGKSTLLQTLIGQYRPTDGEILFQGEPMSEFDKRGWKEFRRKVQIIFQDPFNTMNPKFTVREALREPLEIHGLNQSEERFHEALKQVELKPTEHYIDRRESQLSGGEKQRVSIARALISDPEVILADEPVSMLDVSTQASLLRLLKRLTSELDVSIFYVSHDLSTVSYVCDRVNVMYLGRVVESAPTEEVLDNPKHPYTQALTRAVPVPDPEFREGRVELEGSPGDPSDMPHGCRFKDRCPERMDICDVRPNFETLEGAEHQVACHLYYEHEETPVDTAAEPITGVSGNE